MIFSKRNLRLFAIAGLVILLGVIAVGFWIRSGNDAPRTVRLAEAGSVWWSSAPTLVMSTKGNLNSPGMVLEKFDVLTGLASKNAVVQGNADIGVVSSSPLVMAIAAGEPVVVLGSYMRSSHLFAIIHAMPEQQATIHDLPVPVGFVKGTNSETYVREYLRRYGSPGDLERLDGNSVALRANGILPSFTSGSVATVSIWEPIASEVIDASQEGRGQDVRVIRDPDIYENWAFFVTSADTWNRRRPELLEFMASARVAAEFIRENPGDARELVEDHYGYKAGWLKNTWDNVDFELVTERDRLAGALTREAELLRAHGMIGTAPNLADALRPVGDVTRSLHVR